MVTYADLLPWINPKARECIDASAKGSFLELTIGKAEILLDR